MKQNDDKKWLDELLSKKLKNTTEAFDFQQWQEKYPSELQQLRQMKQTRTKTTMTSWSLIWRTIMKNPYTKYITVAACLFIAAFFLFPQKGISPDSILFADVERKILDQHSCMITGTRILSTKDKNPRVINYTFNKYLSREYGYVDQTFDEEGNLFISVAVHHPSNAVTVLFPQMKRYLQLSVTQKYQDQMKEITPLKLFQLFFSQGGGGDMNNVDLEKLDIRTLAGVKEAEIDGVPVVGFGITSLPDNISKLGFETLPLFLDMQDARGHIWINPETLLPVQLDGEIDIGKCILTNFKEMTLSEVDHFGEWNMEIDEGMFLPEIPEYYEQFVIPKMKTTSVMSTLAAVSTISTVLLIK